MIEQKKAITKAILAKNFNWSWYNRKIVVGLVYFLGWYILCLTI